VLLEPMRTFGVILFILVGHFGFSQTLNLTISISEIKDVQSVLNIGVYNDESNFPVKGEEWIVFNFDVNQESYTFEIEKLPKGEYAIAIFQDENLDNECNTNILGLPKENYGFSNNFRPRFTRPSFDDCKIELVNDTTIFIELH